MEIKLSKSDVIWSYVAQFFNIGSGVLTLPLILHMLSTEEIAMNYLMMTIGAMVSLIDFGFAPQFGRNISYVYSGAQKLLKEGVKDECVGGDVNYHLLKALIDVAKKVYRIMSLIVLLIMLTLGTLYIYQVTNGFSNVNNSFFIWVIYSVSTYFNIYFCYYTSLLTGRGLIMESKRALLASRILYILLAYVLILCNLGLIGLCLANLISPFLSRAICYHYFYDENTLNKLKEQKSSTVEQKELFKVIWYNAKKLGINFVGSYAISRFSMFIIGLYLAMDQISSYGLMTQLAVIIAAISSTFFNSLIPKLASYRVSNNIEKMLSVFSMAMLVYISLFVILSAGLIIIGPWILELLKSNATLPSPVLLSLFLFIIFLEHNHGNFATFITIGNEVPFVTAALVSGAAICIGDILVLHFTDLGLYGIILVQGIVQIIYNNWYWPFYVFSKYNINVIQFFSKGFSELVLIKKYKRY